MSHMSSHICFYLHVGLASSLCVIAILESIIVLVDSAAIIPFILEIERASINKSNAPQVVLSLSR